MNMITKEVEFQDSQISLLKKYKNFGFKSESALVAYALELFQKQIQKKAKLEESANLYAEIYEEDNDLQMLTESALNDFE